MKDNNTKLFQKKLALKKELLKRLNSDELKAVIAGAEPTEGCTFPCI